METVKLSSKGQLVIPKAVRDAFDWRRGMEFCVQPVKEGILLRPTRIFAPTRLRDVLGCVKYGGRRKSVGEMRKAVQKAGRWKRALG
jgi:AbrB family looped-hinge helix DNA binding protein